jgi:hypothetical protein
VVDITERKRVEVMQVRIMLLPKLRVPDTADSAIGLYKSRLQGSLIPPLAASCSLLAYMAWPNDDLRRDGWMATNVARLKSRRSDRSGGQTLLANFGGLGAVADISLDAMADEVAAIEKKWPSVGDILMRVVDMENDDRLKLLGGPSISKAIALNEYEQQGLSQAQSYRQWQQFREVAHLIAAGAFLADSASEVNAAARSIFSAIWYAPDAVLAVATGFEQFGLNLKPHGQTSSVLPPNTTWRVPNHCRPERPFLLKRRLSAIQVDFLNDRRAPKRHISKRNGDPLSI